MLMPHVQYILRVGNCPAFDLVGAIAFAGGDDVTHVKVPRPLQTGIMVLEFSHTQSMFTAATCTDVLAVLEKSPLVQFEGARARMGRLIIAYPTLTYSESTR